MNGRFLLDTNIVTALFSGDSAVCEHMANGPRVLISVVVLGELYYGAQKSRRIDENLRRINRLLTEAVLLENDAGTAFEYGLIRNELRLDGRPIPENDLWVAAAARQHGLVLVLRDNHFTYVEGLKLEAW